jgi:hypothetical protein
MIDPPRAMLSRRFARRASSSRPKEDGNTADSRNE